MKKPCQDGRRRGTQDRLAEEQELGGETWHWQRGRDRDRPHQGRDIDELNGETKTLTADGDPGDRRRERGSEWMINGEPKRMQGQGEGWTSHRQDEGDNDDGQPGADDDC